jgi:hypothetical protein
MVWLANGARMQEKTMNETCVVKDLAVGAVIRVDGFDDPMTVRAAKKVKQGLNAGKLHVTLATPDGATEVVALDPQERVQVVRDQYAATTDGPTIGEKSKKKGGDKGKGKGKAKSKATPPTNAETTTAVATVAAATSEPQATDVPAPKPVAEAPKKTGRQKKAESGAKKLSAIDAAAKVLTETGTAMNCQELIQVMADKGYWTSPGGKTPHATLYAAILRELQTKGNAARFQKAERGKFEAVPGK